MRYTRYDYNKKKKNNFGISLLVVIALGIVIGIGLFKLMEGGVNKVINNKYSNNTKEVSSASNKVYIAIQCGVYENVDNANKILSSIPSTFQAFIVQEDGKYKVIAGIYDESVLDEKIKELNNASVNNFSVKFKINSNDIIIGEMIDAYLQIINKVTDDKVESINTDEFKKWITENGKDSEEEDVKSMINMANSLPTEYKKENNGDLNKYLYTLLNKYKI